MLVNDRLSREMLMDIISYRGPGAPGGVSSGLLCARKSEEHSHSPWWFFANNALHSIKSNDEEPGFVTLLPENVIAGHYKYCNDFLWPLMHDLPEYVTYSASDREHYRQFNQKFASYICFETSRKRAHPLFVQDYQLALLPRFLYSRDFRSIVFWHIPWPKNVQAKYVDAIAEIARGLLATDLIGFHTTEYAANFAHFVTKNLPECRAQGSYIYGKELIESINPQRQYEGPYIIQQHRQHRPMAVVSSTRLAVKPLGIDPDHWFNLQATYKSSVLKELEISERQPFILSVDRADYTKSVCERIQIIDKFFERNPNWKERLSFIQVCGRTRAGLPAFDQYWQKCHDHFEKLNEKWKTESWRPLLWIDKPLSAEKLSALYHRATAMLVNPVRDGLNLTAKEFAACQEDKDPGVLLLSPGTGAWHELGQYALPAHPCEQEQTVLSIERALNMSSHERQERNIAMREILRANDLKYWWSFFNHQAKTLRRNAHVAPTGQAVTAIEERKVSA